MVWVTTLQAFLEETKRDGKILPEMRREDPRVVAVTREWALQETLSINQHTVVPKPQPSLKGTAGSSIHAY